MSSLVFDYLPSSPANVHTKYEVMLRDTLSHMILGQMHPCTQIEIVVQVIEDDGSVPDAYVHFFNIHIHVYIYIYIYIRISFIPSILYRS